MQKSKVDRQLELEQEQIEIGVKRYRDKIQDTPESEMPPGLALMNMSIEPVKKAIDELKNYNKGGKRNHEIKRFLQELDSYEVAYLTCRQVINKLSMPINLQGVAVDLSKALVTHYEYKKFKTEMPHYVKAIKENMDEKGTNSKHRRGYVMMNMKRKKGIEDTDFSNIDMAHMGVKLIEIFIETTGLAKLEVFVDGKKKMYMIDGTEKAKEWIQDKHAQCELLSPEFLPMLVEPIEWQDPYAGGYLTSDSNLQIKLVKTRNQTAVETLKNNPESMQEVYETINTLQKTKWEINTDILAIMEDAWVSDAGIGDIPTDREEPLPVRPWGILEDDEWEQYKDENEAIVKGWKAKARDVHQRRIKNRSKRYQMARKLWVARKFKDEEELYFCWVLDWRGRVYPIQNHVNPQGDDSAKALLKFSEGKPLGERGAYWLKVHIANCFGADKVSFEDRVAWVNNNQDQIVASAEDPMVNRFWEEADDPWQALAGAMELKGYIEQGPEFISHLPVAMDGSCNGLQNFAGMLKDPVGGESVNLLPAEKPQDVYQRVADKVEELIDGDHDEYAQAWTGKVTRKIVKRPVMTLPYGVTFIGMQDQIKNLLVELDEDGPYLGGADNKHACRFLVERIQESLTQTVTSAREAMDWLQDVTRVVNKAELPVVWTTPIGYIPYQNYKKQKSKRIETFWGSSNVRIRLSVNEELEDLDKRGQVSGIAPNFVHSMDASHMMMTVLRAKEEGVQDFAMIHDSFGTHASDIDTLQRVIRESFVEMYTDHNVLEEFYNQVKDQLPEKHQKELPEVPKQGNLDLQEVLKSRYFFA